MEYVCINVPGGWQTAMKLGSVVDGYCYVNFGPVFNKATELWNWQKTNLTNVTQYELKDNHV